ncbi:type II toxin-antitoxin system RelB/DinJ family antitoxin [Fructilactobacillus hinvesii]|uniref:Type II toxin-antitoxin system RelB/DinJ family antitoxin n=1 Tax=Fructilactobacillus hinvesii TaxID=2940300 RepID=A0ABY5BSI6_9LACO|nr:type II toxin-antitoxin system RelB/DinJ family antitoxin [Fructilactobacillus hinvesii]USS88088.1 type II toxin-antitoxin system RelB/DinJ family antitoxin [Fructilactobacillus hinvesii]
MTKTDTRVTVKVDEKTKEAATKIYEELGLTMSSAIKLFLAETVQTKSIPFQPKIKDQETINAINDAYTGNTVKIGNINDFDKWLENV